MSIMTVFQYTIRLSGRWLNMATVQITPIRHIFYTPNKGQKPVYQNVCYKDCQLYMYWYINLK